MSRREQELCAQEIAGCGTICAPRSARGRRRRQRWSRPRDSNAPVAYGWRASHGAARRAARARSIRCGSSTATLSSHSVEPRARAGRASTSAAIATSPFAATRMRRIVPRLRKSGSAGQTGFCLIIDRISEAGMQASCRTRRHPGSSGGSGESASRALSACAAGRGKAATRPGPAGRYRSSLFARVPPTIDRHHGPDAKPPPCSRRRRLVGPLQRACRRSRQALHRVGRLRPAAGRRVDIAGSLAHARMLAAIGVLSRGRSGRDRARDGDDPRRNRRAASSRGRATSRTSTSTSSSG